MACGSAPGAMSPRHSRSSPPAYRSSARGRNPKNEYRPRRPRSADSSRKHGPASRSLRKAETGVSQSSTKVMRIGMALAARASSWASSRLGRTSGASSAATAIERLQDGADRDAARQQQYLKVVEHVSGLLDDALVGLLGGSRCDLLRLLADLLADPLRIVEEPHRV